MSSARVRLASGQRVTERGDGTLQVGLHADRRLVLPDDPDVRRLLARLAHPTDPAGLPVPQRALVARLSGAGLVEATGDAQARERALRAGNIELVAADPARALLRRLLTDAGLTEARGAVRPAITMLVTTGAEPRRPELDRLVQADQPHLLVTSVAGRVRVGPLVVPGLTACVHCVDEHLADRDPRHALLVDRHLDPDRSDRPAPGDLALGLAWAVRDVAALLAGDRPWTWSASVEVRPDGPVTQPWRRHPRCGCAWGDLRAG